MKTAEQIAGHHSLSSCARCDCALGNGGVCKRLVGLIGQMRKETTQAVFKWVADDLVQHEHNTCGEYAAAIGSLLKEFHAKTFPAP